MNRRLNLAAICAALLVAIPASSCGPDFPVAVFVLPHGPDGKYLSFAEGHIGIPQPGYRTRSLVIAFDYLTHHPLTPTAQQQAVTVDQQYLDSWQADEAAKQSAPTSGFHTWISTRSAFGPVDGYTPDGQLEVNRSTSGDQYEDFMNCLDNAFSTAARTLSTLSRAYGVANPFVIEWARGQDAVFSNCGDGKQRPFFGPGKPPTPPLPPHLPHTLPANMPQWLQQDRAYQFAAARFYALDFDAAANSFRTIAADQASPWSVVSRYLVARALIRQSTLADSQRSDVWESSTEQVFARSKQQSSLAMAQKELLSMRDDPHMSSMQIDIDRLLDYVNLRLQPEAQSVVLAQRLQSSTTRDFGQSLIDLTWLRTNQSDPEQPTTPLRFKGDATGMIAWIEDVNMIDQAPNAFNGGPSPHTAADVVYATADILHRWETTHANVWLVAALMSAHPSDLAVPDLLRAATNIPSSDPAYVAVTYHRLRLMPRDSITRDQLLSVLPAIQRNENISTLNQFIALNSDSAPNLEAWLATTGRLPASESSFVDQGEDGTPASSADVCGTKIAPSTTRLFDVDAANAFNREMPLRLLAASAESDILPENLRYQLAQAALARAILLDQPAIARSMTPLLVHCRSTWAPLLEAYDASTTTNDRKLNGLLALMRFASVEPSVRNGEERHNGFATYDSFRQNWWCTTVPKVGRTVDDNPTYQYIYTYRTQLATQPAQPLFLTAADKSEAATEVAALEQIPSASQYFATQALSWWKLHPSDPHTPDLLGEADRVLRNSCRTELPYDTKANKQTGDLNDPKLTSNLAHSIFNALHKDYPQSVWVKRYKSWE